MASVTSNNKACLNGAFRREPNKSSLLTEKFQKIYGRQRKAKCESGIKAQ